MPGTITLGTVTYGAFNFPKALHSSFRSLPVPDPTGRTIKYVRTVLAVDTVITPTDLSISGGSNFAETFQLVIAAISKPGQTLTLASIFLGGTVTQTRATDFEFGPTPQNITYEPIAGNQAYRLHWECAYTRAICDSQQLYASLSVGDTLSIAPTGMATLTVLIDAELAIRRVDDHRIQTLTNQYLEQVQQATQGILPNFERSYTTEISPDRKKIQVRITYAEIASDNPFFPYMVKMQVRESLKGGLASGGLKRWQYRIAGTLELAPGIAGSYAWIAFLSVVQTRISAVSNSGNNADGTKVVAIAPEFEWDNEIYGRSVSFSLGYTLVCDLAKVLAASGIWKPVEGTSWSEWSTSLADVQRTTGYAGLTFQEDGDLRGVIVDFCLPISPGARESAKRTPSKPYNSPSHSNQCPPENSSWLEYENRISIDRQSNTISHYPLSPGDAQFSHDFDENGKIIPSGNPSSVKAPHTQSRGASTMFLIMRGKGVRVGYKVPIPKVTKIGNTVPTVVSERNTASHIVGWSGNCPIYGASWEIVYRYYSTENNQTPTIEGVPPAYKK